MAANGSAGEPTPRTDEAAGPAARFPVPAAVSILLLVLVLAGGLWLALSLDPVTREGRPATARGEPTMLRDVLTGRLADEYGVPIPPPTGPGSHADEPIRFRFVPSTDTRQSAPSVRRLVQFLQRRTGYFVEGATLHSYGLVIQELLQKRCDVAFLTATSYARARFASENNEDPDDDVEAFLAVVRRGNEAYPGSDLAYRAVLIVRDDSPIRTLADITDDHIIGLGPPTSGASGILPSDLLRRLGVRPRVHRMVGYPFIVNAVLQGVVDVGSIWWSPPNEEQPNNDARQLVVQTNPDVFERTRIIGPTAWIPNEPVVARKTLPADVRHTLARALCLYASQLTLTREGRQELVAVGSPVGFIPATNADFLPLMEVIEQAFADDPDGRRHFMAGSR